MNSPESSPDSTLLHLMPRVLQPFGQLFRKVLPLADRHDVNHPGVVIPRDTMRTRRMRYC